MKAYKFLSIRYTFNNECYDTLKKVEAYIVWKMKKMNDENIVFGFWDERMNLRRYIGWWDEDEMIKRVEKHEFDNNNLK